MLNTNTTITITGTSRLEDTGAEILGMEAWWGMDLRTVEGLLDAVKADLEAIWNKGMTTAMKELLEK